jgi:hypothetical protein
VSADTTVTGELIWTDPDRSSEGMMDPDPAAIPADSDPPTAPAASGIASNPKPTLTDPGPGRPSERATEPADPRRSTPRAESDDGDLRRPQEPRRGPPGPAASSITPWKKATLSLTCRADEAKGGGPFSAQLQI